MFRQATRVRTGLLIAVVAIAGVAIGRITAARDPGATTERAMVTAPLRIVDGDLAVLFPDGCEDVAMPQGSRSARVRGDLIENDGEQAQIISTEFHVTAGEREWSASRTWRVPVGERIADVQLTRSADAGGGLQAIEPPITRCILFVERAGTYVPPIEGPPPHGAGAQSGVRYDFVWHVHCGATILGFDGRWWRPSPALSDDPYNPPPGWEDGEPGKIELIDRSRARFTTNRGQPVNLVPVPTPKEDPTTGCN